MAIVPDHRVRYSRRGGYYAYGGFGNGGGVEYGTGFTVTDVSPSPEPAGPSPLDYITAATKLVSATTPFFVKQPSAPPAGGGAPTPAAAAVAAAKAREAAAASSTKKTYLLIGAGVLGLVGVGLALARRR